MKSSSDLRPSDNPYTCLRTDEKYNGPLLADSLTKHAPVREMFKYMAKNEMISVPASALLLAPAALACSIGSRALP